ncbi:MAG: hypothetical protein ACLRWQ_18250 [Flavonifractor plautii]
MDRPADTGYCGQTIVLNGETLDLTCRHPRRLRGGARSPAPAAARADHGPPPGMKENNESWFTPFGDNRTSPSSSLTTSGWWTTQQGAIHRPGGETASHLL